VLKSFAISNTSLSAHVDLYDERASRFGTWISVLIGQNGSRKSFILRQILQAALDDMAAGKKRNSDLAMPGWEDGAPANVICISGTPLDRFPRAQMLMLGSQKKQGQARYLYLGQRAANGMAGIAQSERALMVALFLNADQLRARAHIFERVFNNVGFAPRIDISLKLGKELERHDSDWVNAHLSVRYVAKDAIEDYARKAIADYCQAAPVERHSPRLQAVLNKVSGFDFTINGIFKLLDWFDHAPPCLVFEKGEIRLASPVWKDWGIDELEVFVRAGLIEVSRTRFFKQSHHSESARQGQGMLELPGDHLSSGQWSWLAGLVGLAAHITDSSLVLIDEPENSLHPLWQQQYITTLNAVMREFRGAQAMVVTHSPIIASGVEPGCGQVQALIDLGVNEAGQQLIESRSVPDTYGWRASDVYEAAFDVPSSRAPFFTLTADVALALIREDKRMSVAENRLFQEELTQCLASLPPVDPLRTVLSQLLDELRKRTGHGVG